jgi:anhydro-N-acetylmuramic acid kinase
MNDEKWCSMTGSTYRAIGLMSGSSLDGLDMACCEFTQNDGTWSFSIHETACLTYSDQWIKRLSTARDVDGKTLWQLHADFGRLSGRAVHDFIDDFKLQDITLIGSHGHTVFHYPQNHFTTQIGDGAALAAESGLPVVCDFRGIDVAKSGQGAPLVPIGDKLLFGEYRFLLNLGGISNVTVQDKNGTVAFDICSANQILNHYARHLGMEYDDEGKVAAQGQLNQNLFATLNELEFYKQSYPKSLDNGYSTQVILPILERAFLSVEDVLYTFCEHIAYQVAAHINAFDPQPTDQLLVTGGGALNTHLIKRITHHVPVQVVQPDKKVIQYKEALIFAFMGVLRWTNQINIYNSVTGATSDSIAGAIYLP